MKLESLEQFMFVMRYRNISKAAEALFVSHSTISRNIASMEEELGVKLFERGAHELIPTYSGEILADRYEVIRISLAEAFREVRIAGQSKKSALKIGLKDFYDSRLFRLLREIRQKENGISFELVYKNPRKILEALERDEVDLAMVFSIEITNNPLYEVLPLYKDQICLIVSETDNLAKKESVCSTDLSGYCIYTIDNTYRDIVRGTRDWILEDLKDIEHRQENGIPGIMMQVRAGNGAALLPSRLVETSDGLKKLFFSDLDTSFDVMLAWKKNNERQDLISMIDRLKKEYKL